VVCDAASTVLAVIELDDRSHDDPRRSKADQDKEAALAAAGIRLIRWNAAVLPGFDQIAADLFGAEASSA
jgi:very-short-patch-repair endonuclease